MRSPAAIGSGRAAKLVTVPVFPVVLAVGDGLDEALGAAGGGDFVGLVGGSEILSAANVPNIGYISGI